MNVVTAAPMPPEVAAYTLARYSRSSDDLATSLNWVRDHSAGKFLEDFYFKFGHPSIADLGHVVMSLEGISEIAAVEIEDEPLWDGMAKSTRYQDFSKAEPVIPEDLNSTSKSIVSNAFEILIKAYVQVLAAARDYLAKANPKPPEMKDGDYDRAISARAFDVARYLLPMCIPTNVGQVVSIRTLEKQIRRLLVSPYHECQVLANKMITACGEGPTASYYDTAPDLNKVAPTLAKHVAPSEFQRRWLEDVSKWYNRVTRNRWGIETIWEHSNNVRLHGTHTLSNTNITRQTAVALLYRLGSASYGMCKGFVESMNHENLKDLFVEAVAHRGPHDELPREFRTYPYTFEITMDLGAYRDLHRHRRCNQIRQDYTTVHRYETPDLVNEIGMTEVYDTAISSVYQLYKYLPVHAADYVLPFATRVRTLFMMDFAEADYICRLRSKVGGHFSYRRLVWQMAELLKREEPYLRQILDVTDPNIEAPLLR